LPSILPPLQVRDALQTAAIHSISQQNFPDDWQQRPFRSPHHTCSSAAMIGGGSQPRPGEISLANNGVLFLDEFPEFDRNVLEAMREPLETHQVHISRAAHQATFPARFQLIAAMNPCKCGYANDPKKRCDQCTPAATAKYQQKISGPLRDRIDIQIEVPAVDTQELISSKAVGESSELVRARVVNAWEVQVARQGCANALLSNPDIESVCHLDATQQNLLAKAIDQLGLSARAYHRILKVARTIADLDHSQQIHTSHLTEAIGYRRLDTSVI
jgi:magnesium chelatase family protein